MRPLRSWQGSWFPTRPRFKCTRLKTKSLVWFWHLFPFDARRHGRSTPIADRKPKGKNDPNVWSGRASQEVSSIWFAVLHQCIRPLIGAAVLRAIMDISAGAFSLSDRPRSGHLGHQCSHALGRPNLHLVSSSRRPRLEIVDRVTSSFAPHVARFLCSNQGPFLRPGPQSVDRVARRGGQGRPSRLTCGWLRRLQAAP